MDKERPGILAFAGLGLLNAMCLAAGMFVGWLVDRALGTLPLFLFLGLLLFHFVFVFWRRFCRR